MSAAREHALAELRSLADGDWLRIEGEPKDGLGGSVQVDVSIGTPPALHPSDAWDVRAREDFTLIVSPDYPFAAPRIDARHLRWTGAPHVQWGRAICLYATTDDWDPQGGLHGFFERLGRWLGAGGGVHLRWRTGRSRAPARRIHVGSAHGCGARKRAAAWRIAVGRLGSDAAGRASRRGHHRLEANPIWFCLPRSIRAAAVLLPHPCPNSNGPRRHRICSRRSKRRG